MVDDKGIVWEEPRGSRGRGSTLWIERLAPVTERPNEWACVGDYNRSIPNHLKTGGYNIPPGRWEFRGRKVNARGESAPRRRAWLYARYLGPDE